MNSILIRLFHFITLKSDLNIDTSWDEMEWNVMGNVETGILDSEDELCGRLVYNYRYTQQISNDVLFPPELRGLGYFSTLKLLSGPSVWIHVTSTTEPRSLPLMTKDNLIYW